jgi:hypothetical protein
MSGLVDLETVDISAPEVLQVKTTQGSLITFSMQNFDAQLEWWRVTRDAALRAGKVIGTFDLSVKNNSPATWIEASAAPAGVPRNHNLQRNRKKNV